MSHSLVSVVSKHCIHEQIGSGLLVVSGPAIGASLEREERARVRLTQFDFRVSSLTSIPTAASVESGVTPRKEKKEVR